MQPQQDLAGPLISRIKTFSGVTNGIRIIANLQSSRTSLLVEFREFKSFLENELKQHTALDKSAEFYHNFNGDGFAGIDCFRNSHISVRTYPGVNDIVFDMFLSNELPGNNSISESLYQKTIAFFDSKVLSEKVTQC